MKKNSRSYHRGLGEGWGGGGGTGGITSISHPQTPSMFSMCEKPEDEDNYYQSGI